MLNAFSLALGQLADPLVRRTWLKSLGVTLLAFAAIGAGLWWLADSLLALAWPDSNRLAGAGGLRALLALAGALLGAFLLWRVVALAVLQFFADEVIRAVEARHYPAAAATARQLGWHEELANGLRSAGRALFYNALALPFALLLLVTGIGAPLVFFAVNAVLLGRELEDMVWLRHRPAPQAPAPLRRWERLALGGITTALLAIPVANLAAPFLGAAAAAHLIHRKKALSDAP
jgi:uncharacterized protein involved in cysteine biosynthesis